MGLFQSIRKALGLKTEVQDIPTPIETLDRLIDERGSLVEKLEKAQNEFDQYSFSIEKRISECDEMLLKGGDAAYGYNRTVLSKRLDKITDEYVSEISGISKAINNQNEIIAVLEADILKKSIEMTALLPAKDQKVVGDLLKAWELTGVVGEEEYSNQLRAITAALEIVAKGESEDDEEEDDDEIEMERDEFEEEHDKLIDVLRTGTKEEREKEAKKQRKEADKYLKKSSISPVDLTASEPTSYEGHYANMIVKRDGKILFLKRANDKVIAPGQYCLPGGHIDDGETISEAGIRELKEEAGLDVKYADLYAKARCHDGKWAFYLYAGTAEGEVVIDNEESSGAAWMDEDEWLEADLIFDLKEHLKAMECRSENIDGIHTIKKGEDGYELEKGQFYGSAKGPGSRGGKVIGHTRTGKPIYETYNHPGHDRFTPEDHADAARAQRARKTQSDTNRYVWNNRAKQHEAKAGIEKAEFEDDFSEMDDELLEDLVKGGRGLPIGTKRVWNGIEWVKTAQGWIKTKQHHDGKKKEESKKRHGTKELVAHAENTSSDQLKKVSKEHKDAHIRDSAKRELERRKADKEKAKAKAAPKTDPAPPVESKKEGDDKPVKKKPAFEYSPSETLKDEGHKKIEKRFGKELSKNYERNLAKYEKMFGHVLNTDNVRDLSKDYQKNKSELSAAVHEPASAFIKKVYEDKLKEKLPKGKQNMVYFTGGGTGAGKSSGLMGAEKAYHDKAHIVYDTNMNTFNSAKKKIDQALAAGKKIRINYTFRDPIDAFENGAVPRSLRIGRTVPIEAHIDTHLGSMDAIQALADHYKADKRVRIVVTDNSNGWGKAKQVPVSFVKDKQKLYNATDLRRELHAINDRLLSEGKISVQHHKGFKGD